MCMLRESNPGPLAWQLSMLSLSYHDVTVNSASVNVFIHIKLVQKFRISSCRETNPGSQQENSKYTKSQVLNDHG